ncbi:MAG: MFS transporter [Legionellales bacterium]|nr:MFS transporter [Legionellales bacterium]
MVKILLTNKLSHSKECTDWFSVLILMMTAIVFVTAELVPVGILPEISASFQQPIGTVGLMVTAYAWSVGLTAVLITSWLAPLERRTLLLLITLLFAGANLLIACASSLNVLFIARVLGAFGHGVFWSIVGPLCVRVSGSSSKARATAIVFGGIAVATVLAVPAGTLLAQYMGWRFTFGAVALTSVLLAIAIAIRFPRLTSENRGHLNQLFLIAGHPLLMRVFLATILALTGHFCAFTYVSLLLEKGVGIAPSHLAFYLFLFGGAGVLGSALASKLADQNLRYACFTVMAIMSFMIMIFSCLPMGSNIIAALLLIIWGGGICVLTIGLQSLILVLPVRIADAASAIYVSMFNIGIGSGAFLGGLLVDHFPLATVGLIGGMLLLIAAMVIGLPIKNRNLFYDEANKCE